MQRFLIAFCAALLIVVAAINPTFAQEPAGTRSDGASSGISLMHAMEASPETPRTMVFVVVEDETPYEKIAAQAEEGSTESTICSGKVCVCKADSHGSCDLFKWLCVKLGGQHTEGASTEGCFF